MSHTTASIKRSESAQTLYEGLENLPSAKRFTREQLEVIYAMAYAHVAQSHYAQALPIFAFLAQYGPTRRHYLYGLALSLQMVGRVEEAISIYSLCSLLFPDSFEAAQRLAQCQVAAGRREEACDTLNMLLQYARTSSNTELEHKAQGMLDLVNRRASA